MRDGPDFTTLLDATISTRVDVVRGRQTLALDLDVWDVQYSTTSDRVVPTQVKFNAPLEYVPTDPGDPLNNYGQRIHLWVKVAATHLVPVWIEIGWFQIEDWQETEDSVAVTCLDLLQRINTNEFDVGSSPPRGATLRSELQRLADDVPVMLDDVEDGLIPTTFQWGVNRLEAIADLCAARDLEYGIRPDGYLHVWNRKTGRGRVRTYTTDDLLVSLPRKALPRAANRFITTGKVGSGDNEKDISAAISRTEFPYDSAYGVIVDREELSSATSQSQLMQRTQTRVAESYIRSQSLSAEIIADWTLEVGDVIGLVQIPLMPVVGRVVAIDGTIDRPSVLMRVDVEVLLW